MRLSLNTLHGVRREAGRALAGIVRTRTLSRNRAKGVWSVLFECQQTRDWDFLAPVYWELSARPGFGCYVLLNDRPPGSGGIGFSAKAVASYLRGVGVPSDAMIMKCRQYLWYADAYLTATAWSNFPPIDRRTLRFALPHGLVNKVNQFGEEMRSFDYVLSTGPYCTETAAASRTAHGLTFDIKCAGYPKLDRLWPIAGHLARSRVNSSDDRLRTVLFAPSHGKHAALDVYGLEPVDILLRAGYRVIIKLHPVSLAPPRAGVAGGDVDWSARLKRYHSHPLVVIAGVNDGDRWMNEADIMVSDVSGIAYEFLLIGKPVVFLDVPNYFAPADEPGKDYREHDLCKWGREYGELIGGLDELVGAVERLFAAQSPSIERVTELRERLLYNPGRGGAAVADCVQNVLAARGKRQDKIRV